MNKQYKFKAIKLRKLGNTYSDINRQLNTTISKATFAEWFKNVNLTTQEQQKLQKNIENKLVKARDKSKSTRRLKKKLYFQSLKDKNNLLLKNISRETQKIILSILYLGEGSKSKTSQNFSLGNSNPNIIRFYIQLLKTCFKTDESKFRIRIQCRADQDIKNLENFWLKTTRVHRSQMYPTYMDKRTLGKKTKNPNYKGVCVVTYFNRSIQYELESLAESVLKYTIKGR
jgi:hypothetical protein